MKDIVRKILLLVLLNMSCFSVVAQTDTLPEPDRLAEDFVQVRLFIAEPGDVLYSILGHAALHLQCPYYGLDYVFSYESEGVKGRVARFLMNDLKMGMISISSDAYLQPYREEGRRVSEYTLNLPAEVKSELWRILDQKVAQGMDLPYDYIQRGCAISVLHCVEEAIQSANLLYGTSYKITYPEWGQPFDRTLREIVYDNSPKGWQRFYGMTLVGGQVDNPDLPKKEKLIIPRELVATWQHATIDNRPLLSIDRCEVLPAVNEYKGDRFTPLYATLIAMFVAVMGVGIRVFASGAKLGTTLRRLDKFVDYLFLTLYTLLGLLMLWLLISPLPGSEWSWLIVVFNPLPAVAWKWRDKWGVYYAVLVAVWSLAMICAPHRLVEYAHIVFALTFALVALKPQIRKYLNLQKDPSANTKTVNELTQRREDYSSSN